MTTDIRSIRPKPSSDQLDTGKKDNNVKGPRLPCRGCRPDCENYDRCEGRPWRL